MAIDVTEQRSVTTEPGNPGRAFAWTVRQVSRSPGTLVYLLVLVITTWMLSSLDARTADVLLRQVSTNAVEMSRAAPRVLLLSAFILAGGGLWLVALEFAVIHLTVERWLGTPRWLTIAAAGHVGASIITTVGIWFLLRTGHRGRELVYPVDVGVSYTLAAVAAALVYRLPRWARPIWLIAAMWLFGLQHLLSSPTFTDVGHACALGIGLAVTPLLLPRPATSATARRRVRLAGMGAAMSVLAAVFFGVLAHVSSASADAAASNTVTATVVSVERTCSSGCPRVGLSYQVDGATYRETVSTTVRSGMRVGAERTVRLNGADPTAITLVGPGEQVDSSGFFALSAIAAAIAAIGLAVLAVRIRRRSRPVDGPSRRVGAASAGR